jgi:hypothetical protein
MLRAIWLTIVMSAIVAVAISSRFASMAQIPATEPKTSKTVPLEGSSERLQGSEDSAAALQRGAASHGSRSTSGGPTLQDALLRPYDFPFARPTSLNQVCSHLKQTLNLPVVIDLAALDRQNVQPDDFVQLELQGVRLKTGLKLLLDQVGLTYRIEAEDNLLVITDHEGAQEPSERIWAELRALHRDLHDLQDSLDELRGLFVDDQQGGLRVRKPTIIEEMPEGALDPRDHPTAKPGNPAEKPSAKPSEKPRSPGGLPGLRDPAPRIPLSLRRQRPD